jgi:hypothetical protein
MAVPHVEGISRSDTLAASDWGNRAAAGGEVTAESNKWCTREGISLDRRKSSIRVQLARTQLALGGHSRQNVRMHAE